MPAKKVADKVTKKSARLRPPHDLRRAYEHLGRIDILEGALVGAHFRHVSALTALAQQQLTSGRRRNAADLLRAAEHICFAALAPEHAGANPLVSAELKAAIAEELDQLTSSAEDRWSNAGSPHPTIAVIYRTTLDESRNYFANRVYRPALELARAAEALARLAKRIPANLPADRNPINLLAS